MKKFTRSILYFVLFMGATYSVLIFVWGQFAPTILKQNLAYNPGTYGQMNTRLAEVNKYHDVDILFIGSSHAYRGFDTRIFNNKNWTCFNLGSSAQTPIQTKMLLNTYLESLSPKLIVFDVNPEMFCNEGVESALDIISNERIRLSSVEMSIDVNQIVVYNTLLYGLFMDLSGINKSYKQLQKVGNDRYILGGYVEKKMAFFKHIEHEPRSWVFSNKQFDALSKIIRLSKKRNIQLILVNSPVTKSLYKSYSNNNSFDELMKQQGNYLNFNELLNLDDSLHFYNKDHLNQHGVELYNNRLIELFIQNDFLQ